MQVEIELVRRCVVIAISFKTDKLSTENVKTQTRNNYKNKKVNPPKFKDDQCHVFVEKMSGT